MKNYAYGCPRLGRNREFKATLEGFWKNKIPEKELIDSLVSIQQQMNQLYGDILSPDGEISLYDPFLETAFMLGVYEFKDAQNFYEYCRGKNALPMKKFFNTNYHYLVPEINNNNFNFAWDKWEYLGISNNINILPIFGPFTFIKLSKLNINIDNKTIENLVNAYVEIFKKYSKATIHLEEPALVLSLSEEDKELVNKIYSIFPQEIIKRTILVTYYEAIDYPKILKLPFKGVVLDFIRGEINPDILIMLNKETTLYAGVIDGRTPFIDNKNTIFTKLKKISKLIENDINITNAGPLFHLPITTENEKDEFIKQNFYFAKEKIKFIEDLQNINLQNIIHSTIEDIKSNNFEIPEKNRVEYSIRKQEQQYLNLPLLPTTTIGSFPQTNDVREMRKKFRNGEITQEEYDKFIKEKIKHCIKIQEDIGLDVLVHGEFERTDMVEFFAQKLEGIYTTTNGWVISYGSRVYRPPIIDENIKRPEPMTIKEIAYAQSLTDKPVKGMLTGPITILAWSYYNPQKDIKKLAYEIAVALNQEVEDYIKNGIKIVQIDEPAFREMVPIKTYKREEYFNWAIKAFKLASYAPANIQIHTHMCYSTFEDIIEYIDKLDADVISIETSKSKGSIISAFEKYNYQRQIGLGVWDIHSPLVPSIEQMKQIIDRCLQVIPKENFWINPDCGLKTRDWPEVIDSLKNLVAVAKLYR